MNSDRVGRIAYIWEFSKSKISFPGHDRTQIKKSHCFCSKKNDSLCYTQGKFRFFRSSCIFLKN